MFAQAEATPSAQPRGSSDRHDVTAATSPAVPTMEAGNCPGGPEKRLSKGSSIVTSPGSIETMRMASERWLEAADLVRLLEGYRPLGRSGDVYARLRR